ncbi:hypothetical protein IJ118_00015 [Candidatus Saccharibacteria bacterium]|nr:hypothetical protein [Candidatus Saccharibacteria bacterium]
MQHVLVVYNPNSSQYIHVREDFFPHLPKLKSTIVGKFTIKKAPFEDNVSHLKKVLENGQIVIAAGGDATAAVVVNAALESDKDVTIGVLPYGNFNDLARTLGTMKKEDILDYIQRGGNTRQDSSHVAKLYPLDIIVDGKHWRYASCYLTAGMTAESVELFDEPKFRKSMQKGHKSSWRSYLALAKWYFKNRHKKVFLPEFTLNNHPTQKNISDYCALSGRSMCRVMKGGDDYLKPTVFRSENCRLTSFPRLVSLMMRSIFYRTPGTETTRDVLVFKNPATVELQAEGEYKTFQGIREIIVEKPDKYIKVIHKERK